ncbi:unnamed protein product [Cunninghamella echinulata]
MSDNTSRKRRKWDRAVLKKLHQNQVIRLPKQKKMKLMIPQLILSKQQVNNTFFYIYFINETFSGSKNQCFVFKKDNRWIRTNTNYGKISKPLPAPPTVTKLNSQKN